MRANKPPVVMLSIIMHLDLSFQAMRLWEVVHRTKENCKVYIVSNFKSLRIRIHNKLGSLTQFVGDHYFREKESLEFSDFSGFRTDLDKYFKASLFVKV